MTDWKPIIGEIKRPVVVTNNIEARNAFGHMSHLWVTTYVQRAEPQEHMLDEGFICFDGWQKVIGLTHYAEIDPPHEGEPA